MRRVLSVELLVFVAGCSAHEGRVLVVVDTDVAVPGELSLVRATVWSADRTMQLRDFPVVRRSAPGEPADPMAIPLSFAVEPREDRPSGDFEILVEGFADPAAAMADVSRRAISGFIPGRTLVLPMPLLRACFGEVCPAGQTCEDGICVSARVDPGTLPSVDRPGDELRDGGRDAARADGDICAAPVCELVAPQCGCPSGHACYSEVPPAVVCRVAGSGVSGDACTTHTDCAAGLSCVNAAGLGRCATNCRDDTSCAPPALCSTADGGMACIGDPCDLATGGGCPSGATCDSLDFGAGAVTVCRAVGPVAPGEACTDAEQCGARSACEARSPTVSTCRQRCTSSMECATPTTCAQLESPTTFGVCSDRCDIVDGTGCATGLDCVLEVVMDQETGEPAASGTCEVAGARSVGEACTDTECSAGLACVSSMCMQLCLTAADCSAGTCRTDILSTPLVIGMQTYGVCF